MGKLKIHIKMTLGIVLIILNSLFNISTAQDNNVDLREYLLKAKVINSISHFTSWPSKKGRQAPNICILGNNSNLFQAMTLYFHHQSNLNQNIFLINSTEPSEIENCQIVYIAKIEISDLKNIITSLYGKPILLFSDNIGYAELGVHINLYVDNNKVRFEVNYEASKQAGLDFSSQLLRLAKIVKGEV